MTDAEMAVWSQRVTQIIPVEMLAAVRALQAFTDRVRHKRVILLIDSEAVEGALVKGYSGREDLCQLIGAFWSLVRFLQCELYIDRAPTDSNLADTSSRGKFHVAEECRWQRRRTEHLALTYEGLGIARAELWSGEAVTSGDTS